jgi:hypothetical protein
MPSPALSKAATLPAEPLLRAVSKLRSRSVPGAAAIAVGAQQAAANIRAESKACGLCGRGSERRVNDRRCNDREGSDREGSDRRCNGMGIWRSSGCF